MFNSASTEYFYTGVYRPPSRNFTYSAWVNCPTSTGGGAVLSAGPSTPYMRVTGTGPFSVNVLSSQTANVQTSSGTFAAAGWHYINWAIDASGNSALYIDGSPSGTTTTAVSFGTNVYMVIGSEAQSSAGGYGHMNGSIDNPEVDSVARSSAWIATEYANQSSPPSFGTPSPISSGSRHRVITN